LHDFQASPSPLYLKDSMETRKLIRWFIAFDILLIVLAAIVLALYPSIFSAKKKSTHPKSGKMDERQQETRQSVETGGLKLTLSTSKKSYRLSEEIELNLTIENKASSPKELNFSSGRQFDVWVKDIEEKEIWRWSNDKAFIQIALQSLKLEPGQGKTYKASWQQVNNEGEKVGVGNYTVFGKSEAEGIDKVAQVEIAITD